jgi:S1-C subfamily serine protease
MFHNLLLKIGGFILGTLSLLFPFFGSTTLTYQSVSSTTPQVAGEISTSTTTTIVEKATSTQATTQKKVSPPVTSKKIVAKVPPIVTPTQPTLTQAQLSSLFDQINSLTRNTLVNIFCTSQSSDLFSSASGSGVVISGSGVILTNAHIAQFLLLKDFNGQKNSISCIIRTGSPAYSAYNIKLVYISPTWIKDNSKVITEQDPTGTGEHDYAFLKITSRVDGTPVTDKIPYMPVNISDSMNVGDNALLASYPAGFLGSIDIEKDLYQSSAIAQIHTLYTFATDTVDLISVPGTVVSQKGSSGGAVVNSNGELIGIITTSSDEDSTDARDLRAITTGYINRDLINTAGTDLKTLLGNADSASDIFNQTIAPTLTKILTNSILNK